MHASVCSDLHLTYKGQKCIEVGMADLYNKSEDETDPEKFALLAVQQWLEEQGHASALRALERETGVLYDDAKPARGSMLMSVSDECPPL